MLVAFCRVAALVLLVVSPSWGVMYFNDDPGDQVSGSGLDLTQISVDTSPQFVTVTITLNPATPAGDFDSALAIIDFYTDQDASNGRASHFEDLPFAPSMPGGVDCFVTLSPYYVVFSKPGPGGGDVDYFPSDWQIEAFARSFSVAIPRVSDPSQEGIFVDGDYRLTVALGDGSSFFDVAPNSGPPLLVPEPSTCLLLAMAFVAVAVVKSRNPAMRGR